jgi:site-specific DNA-methyltransferase (adenine-specific)
MVAIHIAALKLTIERESFPGTAGTVMLPGLTSGVCQCGSSARFYLSSGVLSVSISEAQAEPVIISLENLTTERTALPLGGSMFPHSGWLTPEPFAILTGDALDTLKRLPFPVDCVVSSPPYFRKRRYGKSGDELGNESSVEAYVANLVEVFKTIPLAEHGSIWVNLGDTRGEDGGLLRVPHRFAEAMVANGFLLADEVVWAKEVVRVDGTSVGHAMVEPARWRLNGNGHEPFYRFVRDRESAWSDTCAVKISRGNVADKRYLPESLMQCHTSIEGRNLTNVWSIPMGQTARNHYAVYPPALIERAIAMTCPPAITDQGPRERIVEMEVYDDGHSTRGIGKYTKTDSAEKSGRHDTGRIYIPRKPATRGWSLSGLVSEPGIVLDPFCGTGTTGEVAIKLGRRFIGIELYPDYADMAVERCKFALRVYGLNLKTLAADPSFSTTTGIDHRRNAAPGKVFGAMLVAQEFETAFGRPPSILAVAHLK